MNQQQEMSEQEYDEIVRICVDEAPDVIDRYNRRAHPDERLFKGEDHSNMELGSALFDRVLPVIDEHYPELSRFEAAPISDVCYQVAADIIHGDILGHLVEYRDAEWEEF